MKRLIEQEDIDRISTIVAGLLSTGKYIITINVAKGGRKKVLADIILGEPDCPTTPKVVIDAIDILKSIKQHCKSKIIWAGPSGLRRKAVEALDYLDCTNEEGLVNLQKANQMWPDEFRKVRRMDETTMEDIRVFLEKYK